MFRIRSFVLSALLLVGSASAAFGLSDEDPSELALISRTTSAMPGKALWVGLHFRMAEGWHIYSEHPDQEAMIPKVNWELPDGAQVSEIYWPDPISFDALGMTNYGYEDEIVLPVRIDLPANLETGDTVAIQADVSWIACKDLCIPEKQSVSLAVPLLAEAGGVDPRWESSFATLIEDEIPDPVEGEINHFGLALLFALLGGLILNLMPCVLPVISLKILSFINMSGKSRKHVINHGVAFTFGVLLSFWILAGLLIALQAWGTAVGWGFQLQDPRFVGVLAIVLFVLGLSMLGVFELGLMISGAAGDMETRDGGLMGSFWSGVLATAVATPCTGPFLGPVLGYAITVPPFKALLIFTAMGTGMALPYLLFSIFPAAIAYLPRPGMWMVTFKEIMGFLMLGTVIWLVWVFGAQTDNTAVLGLLSGLLSLGIACWIYGKWGNPVKKTAWRFVTYIWISLFAAIGVELILAAAEPHVYVNAEERELKESADGWLPFSKDRVEELRASGTPVFIDFTAKWCVLCQVNKAAFLSKDVQQRFEDLGVVKVRADWTKLDQEITFALQRHGRNGVPLYVLYGRDPKQKPLILPQTLTPAVLVEYLDKIDTSKETNE